MAIGRGIWLAAGVAIVAVGLLAGCEPRIPPELASQPSPEQTELPLLDPGASTDPTIAAAGASESAPPKQPPKPRHKPSGSVPSAAAAASPQTTPDPGRAQLSLATRSSPMELDAAADASRRDGGGMPRTGPVKLVGRNENEVLALLGAPLQQLDAPPGKVWQYAAADCALELFFYLDVASNSFHVLQFQAMGEVAGNDASGQCLQRIYENANRR